MWKVEEMHGNFRIALPYLPSIAIASGSPHIENHHATLPMLVRAVDFLALLSEIGATGIAFLLAVILENVLLPEILMFGSWSGHQTRIVIAISICAGLVRLLLRSTRSATRGRWSLTAAVAHVLVVMALCNGAALASGTPSLPVGSNLYWLATSLLALVVGRVPASSVRRSKALGFEVRPASEICRRAEAGWLGAGRPRTDFAGLVKRAMDQILAFILLLWMLPLLLLIAALVRLDSPGPILFRQRREGVNGSEFDIFKFRTMRWEGHTAGDGARQTCRSDARITPFGNLLRRSSLDEVPQLLNVLNGSMSLVGPRPHPVAMRTENKLGPEITPDYALRRRVKPGITGWAQVNGMRGATATAGQLCERVALDNEYIENWSLWLDLRIVLSTPASLLLRRDNAF